jgi:acyl carrier protein
MNRRDDLRYRVQLIFREVLDSPQLVLTDTMVAKDVPTWDSLNHITLVMTLEDAFNVKFTTREVMGWKNVSEMLDTLEQRASA